MVRGVYDALIGKQGIYKSKDGKLNIKGQIVRGSNTSPTPFYLVDRNGTWIGVELEEIIIIDYRFNPLINAKEYIDRVV